MQVKNPPENVKHGLGGNIPQAIDYLARAAEQAALRSAHEEAVSDFEAALNLLQTLPASRERDQRELNLQIALGAVLTVSRGWAAAERERCLHAPGTRAC